MKTINLNRRVIKIYDSIDELPIINFQKYNKYLLIDSGIGSDVNDIDAHITRIAKFIKAGSQDKALQELQNMRQNMYMINSGISPKYLAFAALIHSIDGKELTDLSDDNLKEVLENIKHLEHSAIEKFLIWLKKKINAELETYFPANFTSAKEKEAYNRLRNRTMLVLDSIVNASDNTEQIEAIDILITNMYTPNNFVGCESAEIKHDKQFENACILIAQKTSLDGKKMTVLQFYNTLDIIKQQIEAETKAYKRIKK